MLGLCVLLLPLCCCSADEQWYAEPTSELGYQAWPYTTMAPRHGVEPGPATVNTEEYTNNNRVGKSEMSYMMFGYRAFKPDYQALKPRLATTEKPKRTYTQAPYKAYDRPIAMQSIIFPQGYTTRYPRHKEDRTADRWTAYKGTSESESAGLSTVDTAYFTTGKEPESETVPQLQRVTKIKSSKIELVNNEVVTAEVIKKSGLSEATSLKKTSEFGNIASSTETDDSDEMVDKKEPEELPYKTAAAFDESHTAHVTDTESLLSMTDYYPRHKEDHKTDRWTAYKGTPESKSSGESTVKAYLTSGKEPESDTVPQSQRVTKSKPKKIGLINDEVVTAEVIKKSGLSGATSLKKTSELGNIASSTETNDSDEMVDKKEPEELPYKTAAAFDESHTAYNTDTESLLSMTDYYSGSRRGKYGAGHTPPSSFCQTEEQVVFYDSCEAFKEETCFSLNREECYMEPITNCSNTGLLTKVEEVCLTGTDEVCSLVESVNVVREEEITLVESCDTEMKEVCHQKYKLEVTEQVQEQCVAIERINCRTDNVTLADRTCTEETKFNCKQGECQKSVEHNCVDTPREVLLTSCQSTNFLCRNLTNQQAVPIMTEICHDRPITVCRMVESVRMVDRNWFSYSVSCNSAQKTVCKMLMKKQLESRCTTNERPVCRHSLGEEKCKEEEKEFCFQQEKVEVVEVCDDSAQTVETV